MTGGDEQECHGAEEGYFDHGAPLGVGETVGQEFGGVEGGVVSVEPGPWEEYCQEGRDGEDGPGLGGGCEMGVVETQLVFEFLHG